MGTLETSIEFCPAGGDPEDDLTFIEVKVEVEYDFQPYEPAVMDVESPLVGPGCDASAELTEIRRSDGAEVCKELRTEVEAWWKRHGEVEAIEREEERLPSRRRRR